MKEMAVMDQRIYGVVPYAVAERLKRYLTRTGMKQWFIVGDAVREYLERHDV